MVELCAAGGAPVNGACLAHDIGLKVFDLALHLPTGDITKEAALDERACAATMAFGMEAVAGGTDLLCVSGLGVGEETVAAAILRRCMAVPGATGDADREGMRPLSSNGRGHRSGARAPKAHLNDPLEALRRLGGREFAAIAGAIIAARMERVPVVLDGPAACGGCRTLGPDPERDRPLPAGAATSSGAGFAKASERLDSRPCSASRLRTGQRAPGG